MVTERSGKIWGGQEGKRMKNRHVQVKVRSANALLNPGNVGQKEARNRSTCQGSALSLALLAPGLGFGSLQSLKHTFHVLGREYTPQISAQSKDGACQYCMHFSQASRVLGRKKANGYLKVFVFSDSCCG